MLQLHEESDAALNKQRVNQRMRQMNKIELVRRWRVDTSARMLPKNNARGSRTETIDGLTIQQNKPNQITQ
jgi:hypothetical protein